MMYLVSHARKGFTIVELLIVIVVIAILAVISIIMYNGIQAKAAESALQSGLRQAATQLGLDQARDDVYPPTKEAINSGRGLHEDGVTFYYDSDGTSYCLTAVSSRDGISPLRIENGGAITEGACTVHEGLIGSGGSSARYSIWGSSGPSGTVTVFNDGDGSLRTANRFYTFRSGGVEVVGLRVWSPAGAPSGYLTESITARAYMNDWQGSMVNGTTTFAGSPVATKVHTASRTAGTWQDILFDSPITLPAITSAANGNDLISLSVQFSGGNYYGIVMFGGGPFESTVSGGQGVYLAEHSDLGRAVHSLGVENGTANGSYVYLIDILYQDVGE